MPFGKYRGYRIEDIPEEYLLWLWDNIELREPLRTKVRRTLDQLDIYEPLPEEQLVKRVYRELASKWHPDHGGSNDAMLAINEFYERLQEA